MTENARLGERLVDVVKDKVPDTRDGDRLPRYVVRRRANEPHVDDLAKEVPLVVEELRDRPGDGVVLGMREAERRAVRDVGEMPREFILLLDHNRLGRSGSTRHYSGSNER